MNQRQLFPLAALVASLLATSRMNGQSTAAQQPATAADSTYLTLLRPLREAGDTTIDMTALRRAFTATSFYSPYDTDHDDQGERMWARINAKDLKGAGQIADSLLSANYLDLGTHIGAGVIALQNGDSATAARHFAIARAVVRSIESTGDGRSADHPLFVIALSEEYSYLGVVGLRRSGMQALSKCAGRACDELEVTPREGGAQFPLYFDVSLPMNWMTKTLSAGADDSVPKKP